MTAAIIAVVALIGLILSLTIMAFACLKSAHTCFQEGKAKAAVVSVILFLMVVLGLYRAIHHELGFMLTVVLEWW